MYKLLQEYSNRYMNVYEGKGRVIIDLIHPRLFAIANLPASTDYPNGFPSSAISGSITAASNLVLQLAHTENIMVPHTKYISMKTLVFSTKNNFGKIYILDEFRKPSYRISDRGPKKTVSKNIASSRNLAIVSDEFINIFHFFSQFNEAIAEIALAILMPSDIVNSKNSISLLQELRANAPSMYGIMHKNGDIYNLKSVLLSFAFPVLKEIKYYESYSLYNVNPESYPFFNQLKKSQTFVQFIKLVTGINGSAFIKRILELSKASKNHAIIVSHAETASSIATTAALLHQNPLNCYIDEETQTVINKRVSLGEDVESAVREMVPAINLTPKLGAALTSNIVLTSTAYSGVTIEYSTNLNKANSTGFSADYSKFNKSFKSIEFYDLNVLDVFDYFKDLVPLDDWYGDLGLTWQNHNYASTFKEHPVDTLVWLKSQTLSARRKIFKTYRSDYLLDTISQLEKYKDISKLNTKTLELYPNGLQMPKKWKTLEELHDLVSKDFNKIKSLESEKPIRYDTMIANGNDLLKLDNIDFGDGWTSELPKTTTRIVEYGALLKHCVASYADRCAISNETVILSINKDGNPNYTLELQYGAVHSDAEMVAVPDPFELMKNGMKYSINQFKGLQNKVPAMDEVAFIIKKLLETGMVTSIKEPSRNQFPAMTALRDRLMNHNIVEYNIEGGYAVGDANEQ